MQTLLPLAEDIARKLKARGETVAVAETSAGGRVAAALLAVPYAALLARTMRHRHGATWGLSETGAAGPSGNRYGDAAGHTCIAVTGAIERVLTLETGHGDRVANMRAFAAKALETFAEVLAAADKA
jgi:nicotinamide-nucleotide amidase